MAAQFSVMYWALQRTQFTSAKYPTFILTAFEIMRFVDVESRFTIVRGGVWFTLRFPRGCLAN